MTWWDFGYLAENLQLIIVVARTGKLTIVCVCVCVCRILTARQALCLQAAHAHNCGTPRPFLPEPNSSLWTKVLAASSPFPVLTLPRKNYAFVSTKSVGFVHSYPMGYKYLS